MEKGKRMRHSGSLVINNRTFIFLYFLPGSLLLNKRWTQLASWACEARPRTTGARGRFGRLRKAEGGEGLVLFHVFLASNVKLAPSCGRTGSAL